MLLKRNLIKVEDISVVVFERTSKHTKACSDCKYNARCAFLKVNNRRSQSRFIPEVNSLRVLCNMINKPEDYYTTRNYAPKEVYYT